MTLRTANATFKLISVSQQKSSFIVLSAIIADLPIDINIKIIFFTALPVASSLKLPSFSPHFSINQISKDNR